MGKQVVVKDGVDGLGVVMGSLLEAVDLVDGLVRGRCVVCHRCCLFSFACSLGVVGGRWYSWS